jgi:Reverse transcriptase (RNA-dependent DNA polymerase)
VLRCVGQLNVDGTLAWGRTPFWVSPIKVVPKPNSDMFRLVVNMYLLNLYFERIRFRYEGIETILQLLIPNGFMAQGDLKDAYLHTPVEDHCAKFFGIFWSDYFFEFEGLPFGWKHSPFVFTKLGRALVAHFRGKGIIFVIYLDDFWICAPTKEACAEAIAYVDKVMADLGLKRAEGKGQWYPTQKLDSLLGFSIDSTLNRISIPLAKLAKIKNRLIDVISLYQAGQVITKRQIYQVAGSVIACSRAFLPARFCCRSLYQLRSEFELELQLASQSGH